MNPKRSYRCNCNRCFVSHDSGRLKSSSARSRVKAVLPEGHPCVGGPIFGKAVQEGHPASFLVCLQHLHNHAACAFPQDHKWKSVEKHLREELGIKVAGQSAAAARKQKCVRVRSHSSANRSAADLRNNAPAAARPRASQSAV